MIDAAISNTYIIMRDKLFGKAKKDLTMTRLRTDLASELLRLGFKLGYEGPKTSRRRITELGTEFRFNRQFDHLPYRSEKKSTCVGFHKKRKRCLMRCSDCKVALCLDCYAKYHTM